MITKLIFYAWVFVFTVIGGMLTKILFEYYNERRYFGVGVTFMGIILTICGLIETLIILWLSDTTFNINIM